MKLKSILSFTVFVLVLILIFQNIESIRVILYFWEVTISASLFYIILFLAGVIIGSFSHHLFKKKKQTENQK